MFKYRKKQIVILKSIQLHPGTYDLINIGTIRKIRNRFNIFRETEYLIHLSDGIIDTDEIRYTALLKWFKESEIKGKI